MGFSQTEYSFNENDGGVVCVVLLNGTIQRVGSVTLTLNATDGSATGNILTQISHIVISVNNRHAPVLFDYRKEWVLIFSESGPGVMLTTGLVHVVLSM